MGPYNFDEIIQRAGTHAVKYDLRPKIFGTEEVIPLWVADMDFRTPDFIAEAIRRRAAHELYGYTFVPESFYESLQSWLKERHGWYVPREWMLYCPGCRPCSRRCPAVLHRPGRGGACTAPCLLSLLLRHYE